MVFVLVYFLPNCNNYSFRRFVSFFWFYVNIFVVIVVLVLVVLVVVVVVSFDMTDKEAFDGDD